MNTQRPMKLSNTCATLLVFLCSILPCDAERIPLKEDLWPPNSLEFAVRKYMDSGDTLPDDDLKSRIQSREKELKPLLKKLVEEPIEFPEYQFGALEMLADLTFGLDDKEFDRNIWIRIALRFKECPFDGSGFFYDFLKRYPNDAAAVFEEIVETGGEAIRPSAKRFLEISKEAERDEGGGFGEKRGKLPMLRGLLGVVVGIALVFGIALVVIRKKTNS